ncbi:MAG: hypothetical protein J0L72_09275 [Armatimonadetes bacterium]|nr:hypothetical protein [Armatimonadota bacterium]
MTKRTMYSALGVLLVGVSAVANAQSTFNFAGPVNTIDTVGDVDNYIASGVSPVATGYILGGTVTYNTCDMTSVMSGTYQSEARMRIRNSAAPTLYIDAQPHTVAAVYTTVSLAAPVTRNAYASTLGNAAIAAATTWSVEFYEGVNDGTAGLPESEITNLNFTLNAVPPAVETLTIAGSQNVAGIVGDAGNSSGTLSTVATSYVMGNTIQVIGGTLSSAGGTAVLQSDVRVRLKNSAYPTYNADVQLSTSGTNWTAPVTLAFATRTAYGMAPQQVTLPTAIPAVLGSLGSTFNGLTIPAGSQWSYEVYTSNDRLAAANDAVISDIVLGTTTGTAYAGATAPTATDLGDINATTAPEATPLTVSMGAFAASEAKWYKFSIPSAATSAGSYIDIWADYADGDTTYEDLEFVLFRNDGYIMIADDDSGPGFFPFISIGDTANPRAAVPFAGTDSASHIRRGWHRAGLPAGTYYLAVGSYNITASDGFNFVGSTTVRNDAKLKFSSNIVGGYSVAGNLELQDTLNGLGNETIAWTATNGVDNASGSVTVDGDMGGAYSINLPSSMTGSVTLKFKGGTFLAKTISFTGGSNLTGQDASCMNGDIDQDGEVGSTDFDAVVAAFGNTGPEDCDNDGEVGASDFDIVVGNFGEGDN